MKKVAFGFLFVLSVSGFLWGAGRQPMPGIELTNKNVVEIKTGFTLEAQIPESVGANVRVYAQLLRMEHHYIMNQPVPNPSYGKSVFELDPQSRYLPGSHFVTPLLNLDIYAFDGNEKKRIDEYGIKVRLFIENSVFEDAFRNAYQKVPEVRTPINLYTYDRDKKVWYKYTDKNSGIDSGTKLSSDFVSGFLIYSWPSDDKMVACGD